MTKRPRIGSNNFPGLWAKVGTGEYKNEGLMFFWDKHKSDGHLLHSVLSPLSDELEKRGFDISTFQFSIKRKAISND